MSTQTVERDFFSMADELRRVLAPHEQRKNELFSRLEEMLIALRESPRGVYVSLENGKTALFTEDGHGIRIYELSKKEPVHYHFELVASEHFLIWFNDKGEIQRITEVDVKGMKRDGVFGYQTDYWQHGETQEMDAMTASQSYLPKLEKYLVAFETGIELQQSR